MSITSLFDRVEALCKMNNITVSALLTEITGSTGNSPTWKKGHIRSDYLLAICQKFDISADYLLTGADYAAPALEPHERQLLDAFKKLSYEGQNVAINQVAALANMYPTGKDGI